MENLKVEYLDINELKPYDKNAKLHPKEQVKQIKESIKQFGMDDPIAVWGEDNLIVEGHGRLMACKELGYTEVPIIRLDHLTEEQRKAYTLVHNKTTMNSDFDLDLLNLELESIVDIDMEDFGFDLAEEFNDEVEDDGWDAPLPEEPKSMRGDIWQLGRHRLLCGDSTSFEDVDLLMDGEQADLLITDPPYNVDYTGKTKEALKIENDKMDNDSFRQFLRDAYSTADSVMRPGACFYIWHADSEGYNFRGACADIGWKVRQCLIWQKNSMVLGRQDYQWQHEPCLYGWKDGSGHLWNSDRKQTTLLEFKRPTVSKLHPTMKPIPLFDYQIKNSAKPGDKVLDLFNGSGTTIMACEQNGRCGYGMELDPRYVDATVLRYADLAGTNEIYLIREGEKIPFSETELCEVYNANTAEKAE